MYVQQYPFPIKGLGQSAHHHARLASQGKNHGMSVLASAIIAAGIDDTMVEARSEKIERMTLVDHRQDHSHLFQYVLLAASPAASTHGIHRSSPNKGERTKTPTTVRSQAPAPHTAPGTPHRPNKLRDKMTTRP